MDPDTAGSQSTAGVRVVTRKYLFDRICSTQLPNIEDKINFLKEDLLSDEIYNEDQIASFNQRFDHFKSEIKKRWSKAYKKEDSFRKHNDAWLQGTFELPIPTQTKRGGRPRKLFEESSQRSKRRKTEEIRSSLDAEIIVHAAQTELRKTGKCDASDVLKEIVSSPTRGTKYKNAFEKSKEAEVDSLTPTQALQMFVDADLTRRQYEIIHDTNKKFFPCYTLLQKAKQECDPPPDECKVTNTSAESNLQALVDLNVRRLSTYLEEVLITLQEQERESLKLIYKWGCDGSQQSV